MLSNLPKEPKQNDSYYPYYKLNKFLLQAKYSNNTIRQYMCYAKLLRCKTDNKSVDKFIKQNNNGSRRAFLRFPYSECFGMLLDLPRMRGRRKRIIGQEEKYMSVEDVHKLIEYPDLHMNNLHRFLFDSGIRINTAIKVNLKQGRINRNEKRLMDIPVTSKGRIVYTATCSASTWNKLINMRKEYMQELRGSGLKSKLSAKYYSLLERGYFFPQSYETYWRKTKQIVKSVLGREDVSPHWFRHGTATYMIEQGFYGAAITKKLGQSDPKSRLRYEHQQKKDYLDRMARTSPF